MKFMTELKNKAGILGIIADKIREQTFVVILLVAFGYWMSMKNDDCNAQQMEMLQTIIKDNTKALDQNSRVLEKILQQ
ncbi:hypothetical protein [Flavilitoribacter nigricans]|uniref:hypothetical protein n=1 Tax=Flavilitoribacter nigricans TaxID=70997 RepID=UPI00117B558F|nr:hypothetical protein [Flavilitoribacter nigricans]